MAIPLNRPGFGYRLAEMPNDRFTKSSLFWLGADLLQTLDQLGQVLFQLSVALQVTSSNRLARYADHPPLLFVTDEQVHRPAVPLRLSSEPPEPLPKGSKIGIRPVQQGQPRLHSDRLEISSIGG